MSSSSTSAAADPDSTMALLSAKLPSVPNYPASDDEEEEEVFFGQKGAREANGRFAVFTDKPNLDQDRLDKMARRSWVVEKAQASKVRIRTSIH